MSELRYRSKNHDGSLFSGYGDVFVVPATSTLTNEPVSLVLLSDRVVLIFPWGFSIHPPERLIEDLAYKEEDVCETTPFEPAYTRHVMLPTGAAMKIELDHEGRLQGITGDTVCFKGHLPWEWATTVV
jgi:hypothetical protein